MANEKSIEMRLSWLKPKNKKMAQWLVAYSKTHPWVQEYANPRGIGLVEMTRDDEIFCFDLIRNWSNKSTITDTDKHRINLLRSAWSSYSKTGKNVTLSLSKEAQSSLTSLSKKWRISKTQVVNELLLEASNLGKIQHKLKTLLKSQPDPERFNQNIDTLNAILNHSKLTNELNDLKEENRRLLLQHHQSISMFGVRNR
ncbi:hypothetical protein [Aliivibrio fischeri]|uniref:hypothetical protein n=1 Tax=Aliivibrio fischeri TaxID=668 RepID=UPI0012D942B8|nr:hypothetical protein [Aliivibrio fischeri]MUK27557.1 hypothetical protein [Aliivibrio fischeri]MUK35681.1 hypothetical protein [Aliivibrio fischeri]